MKSKKKLRKITKIIKSFPYFHLGRIIPPSVGSNCPFAIKFADGESDDWTQDDFDDFLEKDYARPENDFKKIILDFPDFSPPQYDKGERFSFAYENRKKENGITKIVGGKKI